MENKSKTLNIDGTLERIEFDKERLKMLYQISLEEFPKWRVILKEKIDSKDLEAMRKSAHSYKGSTATIGADKANELFLEMENAAKEKNLEKYQKLCSEVLAELDKVSVEIKNYLENNK